MSNDVTTNDTLPFNSTEATEILRAMIAIASADGVVKARERSVLVGFRSLYELSLPLDNPEPLDEGLLASAIVTPEKRRNALRLCLTMAMTDREFSDQERAAVARIARAFKISDDELSDTIDKVRAQLPPVR